MVTGLINGFMKVSGQYCLKLLSYDLSKFFLKNLKSYPKLSNIFWGERHQKLRLVLIFNPTTQFSVDFQKAGVRTKLKIWLLIWNQMKVKLTGQNFKILSFSLTPLFLNTMKNWMLRLKIMASLNFFCLLCPHIWFSLGGDSFLSSSKKNFERS